jgi:plastocyanin
MSFRTTIGRTALLSSFACSAAVQASSVTVQVLDASGHPLADAAVYAEPASGQAVPKAAKTVEIEQKGRKFLPPVTVIQVGTNISFPNNDTVRHHVYSLSPAKVFDLKLYSGKPQNPVNFDKPGTVVIGCNIHDQMIAYIQVVPTPYFAKTDAAGKARLEGLQAGKYRLKAWHFGLPAGAQTPEQVLDMSSGEASAAFTLNTKTK